MYHEQTKKLIAQAIEEIADAEIKRELEEVASGSDAIELDDALTADSGSSSDEQDLFSLIRELTFAGKVKLALLGNLSARSILIRESSRQIQLFVLDNPRITDKEIIEFSKNSNLDEAVFRAIARDAGWIKIYAIKLNLVMNPKTPIDVSLKWLKYIKDKDMRFISKSKNVPQVISAQARKILDKRSK